MTDNFYLRYYVGHRGKFGHEFLEIELRPDGKVRLRCLDPPWRQSTASLLCSAPVAFLRAVLIRKTNTENFHPLQLRYANNSNYKNDTMIRKEVFVTPAVVNELKRIVQDSEVRRLEFLCTMVLKK